jgi:DNA-directed RNA polymerase specialized sigma24 family protein
MSNGREDTPADRIEQLQTIAREKTTRASRAMDGPTSPGRREPTNSREAAECVARCGDVIRALVVALLAAVPAGLSVHEIAARMRLPVSSVAPRISQLRNDGRIKRSGRRRRNASGSTAHIWVTWPDGTPRGESKATAIDA